jgi:hypothetical protein
MKNKKRFRVVFATLAATAMLGGATGAAFGAEKHPPKFNVKSNQCASGANQPHCPGSH